MEPDPHTHPETESCLGRVATYDGVAAVARGDVLITLWRTPARVARIRQVTRWTMALIADNAGGTIAACQFLLPTASPPDWAARAEARRGFREVEPHARRLITVPLGAATWRRLVRAIIRAGLRIFRKARLVKVAASGPEAFELLRQVATPRSPGVEQLQACLLDLYAALGVEPPSDP